MSRRVPPIAAAAMLAASLVLAGCEYVVVPPESSDAIAASGKGWSAVPTAVGTGPSGDLQVTLTIRNDTGLWSAMNGAGQAVLTTPGGSSDCATVRVGTGGHRVAPGLQIRGYQAGTTQAPETELVRVECAGATADAGAALKLDYTYQTGDYNYYDPDASSTTATLEIPLDPVASDLSYPIAEQVDGLVQPADAELTAINGVVLRLAEATRSDTGLELAWTAENPGEYPSSVHIGVPPVVGDDGIIYGYWESPDLESVPVTPPGETSSWTTSVAVPPDVGGLYLLLSVESGKQRRFANYLLDLTAS
jgi:hypothetical protein